MSAAHTPGPWMPCRKGGCSCGQVWATDYPVATVTIGKWGDEFPSLRVVGDALNATAEPFIDLIEYGEVSPEAAQANALLIAAAPDLLEALTSLRDQIKAFVEREGEADFFIGKANAAIAKATGEATHG